MVTAATLPFFHSSVNFAVIAAAAAAAVLGSQSTTKNSNYKHKCKRNEIYFVYSMSVSTLCIYLQPTLQNKYCKSRQFCVGENENGKLVALFCCARTVQSVLDADLLIYIELKISHKYSI